MKAAIISSGEILDYEFVKRKLQEVQLIICADGGGNHAYKMNVIPDVLIGDFDSIDVQTLRFFEEKGSKILKYNPNKDETDTQLAAMYAIEKGITEIDFFCCIGLRFDHTFGNISNLVWLIQKGVTPRIIDEKNEINITNSTINLSGKIGQTVSLLPISEKVSGIYTKGLKYSLVDGELTFDKPRGISNVFEDQNVEIKVGSGILLIIRSIS